MKVEDIVDEIRTPELLKRFLNDHPDEVFTVMELNQVIKHRITQSGSDILFMCRILGEDYHFVYQKGKMTRHLFGHPSAIVKLKAGMGTS